MWQPFCFVGEYLLPLCKEKYLQIAITVPNWLFINKSTCLCAPSNILLLFLFVFAAMHWILSPEVPITPGSIPLVEEVLTSQNFLKSTTPMTYLIETAADAVAINSAVCCIPDCGAEVKPPVGSSKETPPDSLKLWASAECNQTEQVRKENTGIKKLWRSNSHPLPLVKTL